MTTSSSSTGELPITGEHRFLWLDTPLEPDKLLLRSFQGRDAISRLFCYELDLLSADDNLDFATIIGQTVTFGTTLADGVSQRCFHGLVGRFAQLPAEGRLARYHAEVVPQLWLLSRTRDCRIFQNQTVPEIVTQIFQEFGLADFEDCLQNQYRPWDYCVQYRESALNFVLRLLEHEGIFFFFRHEKGKHVLVLGDSPTVHQDCAAAAVNYESCFSSGKLSAEQEDVVFRWERREEIRTGAYASTDYNFEMPSVHLLTGVPSRILRGGNSRYEVYDYPGLYMNHEEGDGLIKLRMEEEETPQSVAQGASNCRAFASGFQFLLAAYPREDQNGAYVLTSVCHRGREGGFYSGIGGEEASSYENTFTCIPASVAYRPGRVAPKPLVHGSQTAIVVGPEDEEIYTDKYGRVKVQFHWDRQGNRDENSSCWIRVSQPWAGNNWGSIAIPRIGQEVIVDFLEGDPDRPIITGRVYNAEQMPPYELPANSTQSGMKSRSSKEGGAADYNEIFIEDKKGQELLRLHAQKDMHTMVENDMIECVGHDRMALVRNDQIELIERNKHLTVKGESRTKIEKDMSLWVGGSLHERIGGLRAVESGQELHIKSGQKIVIEAGVQVSIKGPGGFIDIGPSGVAIQGTVVLINSGGAAGSGSGCNPEEPEEMTIPATGGG